MLAGILQILPGEGLYVVRGCLVDVSLVFCYKSCDQCLQMVDIAIVNGVPCCSDDVVNLFRLRGVMASSLVRPCRGELKGS